MEKLYLIPKDGNFYKANLHCHSTISDGQKTPEEIKEIYKRHGYSVVAYTDHDMLIPHHDLTDDTFLALTGIEYGVEQPTDKPDQYMKVCHLCCIALEKENEIQPMWHRSKYITTVNAWTNREFVKFDETKPDYERRYGSEGITEMMNIARDEGFFVTYNHPVWSQENYPEYMGYSGMHAMEIFNGGSHAAGFDEENFRVYDDMLKGGKKICCIGADDNHSTSEDSPYTDSFRAFTMIKSPDLEYRNITKALEDGNFYSSQGPEIYELYVEDGKVHVECSPAVKIYCNHGGRYAQVRYPENEEFITSAVFDIPEDFGYFRITVMDKTGKRACTNAYFTEEM
ncbi:MAG: PHP domain-containing protein [Clostridia bacterium]|nr:PHP domain-containing protein [Clostridia bacterium]